MHQAFECGLSCDEGELESAEGSVVFSRKQNIVLRFYEGDCRGHSNSANRFCHDDDVRLDACSLEGEEGAGSAASCLNVVNDEHHVMLVAKFACSPQPLFGEDKDTAFSLHGLHNQRRRFVNSAVVVGDEHIHVGDGVHLRHHCRMRNVGDVAQGNAAGIPCTSLGG